MALVKMAQVKMAQVKMAQNKTKWYTVVKCFPNPKLKSSTLKPHSKHPTSPETLFLKMCHLYHYRLCHFYLCHFSRAISTCAILTGHHILPDKFQTCSVRTLYSSCSAIASQRSWVQISVGGGQNIIL